MPKHIKAADEPKPTGRPKVTHHGSILLMGTAFECAVLNDGRRGFIRRQMLEGIGFSAKTRSGRFEVFCEKIGLNPSDNKGKNGVAVFEVDMPHGGTATWVPAEMLQDVVKAGMVAALQGKLTQHQKHIGERCVKLGSALIGVGLQSLIDEGTGYQYVREPDALQDLFAKLISETASDWQKRFHPEFYAPLCKLFGFKYEGRHRPLPSIIGKITEEHVYLTIFPKEIVDEIRSRRKSGALHPWLTEGHGLRMLEKQRDAVAAIAASSVDYRDFQARCAQAFHRPGQQLSMIYPQGRVQ